MPRGSLDIPRVLAELARERPVFHSEADFQFALAWHIQRTRPSAAIRLEYKAAYAYRRGYLDLWVREQDAVSAIELKYFMRRLTVSVDGETYDLVDQGAADIGRYQVLKDLAKVESIVAAQPATRGYVVALTNNDMYWKVLAQPRTTIDAAFRIHERAVLAGNLAWSSSAGAGTTKGIEAAIQLTNRYQAQWRDYSVVASGPRGQFRYLLIEAAR